MQELTKGQIDKVVKRYVVRFTPNYRAFSILQNDIEDVVKKSTQIWKLIYGLTTVKQGEVDTSKGKQYDKDEDKKDGKDDDKDDDDMQEDNKKDDTIGEDFENQIDDKATAEQQQDEQSVQNTQVLSISPPHDILKSIETIIVKDVPDSSSQIINPLTTNDLKMILDQPTLQAKLCENPVLVSVDEFQKVVVDITGEKVNPKEPPSTIPLVTQVQLLIQKKVDTSTKVDTSDKIITIEKKQAEEKDKIG